MLALKRVAVRALSQQSSRHLSTSTFRPQTTRVPISSRPATSRSFHQSRLWLADEKAASPVDAQTSGETVTTSPSAAEEQTKEEVLGTTDAATQPGSTSAAEDAVSEASGSTAEPIQSPADVTAQDSGPALNTSSSDPNAMPSSTSGVDASTLPRTEGTTSQQNEESLMDKARDAASSAADTVQDAGAAAAASARSAFDQTASNLQSKSAEFPPKTPAPTAASSSTNTAPSSGLRSTAPKNKILYIGNLFFEVTAPQLEAEFSRFGTVTNARVVTDQRGLSKGFAYVEFSSQSDADKAVRELDQKVFQGRRMAVQYHVQRERQGNRFGGAGGMSRPGMMGGAVRPPNPPSKTLFIGNMSYQMSDRDLNDLFREIRNVLDVRVAIDRRSGQPRGFAHADFIDVQSAEKAKAYLEKKVIYGRQLKIDYSGQNSGMRRDGGDAEE